LDGARWAVEPRRIVGRTTERWTGPQPPRLLHLAGNASATLEQPYGEQGRLWIARLDLGVRTLSWLAVHGRPIRYGYVEHPWPIEMYQNVYATTPGSAEMPSAGRPFTPDIITGLVAKGVGVVPVVLHTGVASLEADELPYPERMIVPEPTAEWVAATRRGGHRVIAVGTTVVRALETAGRPDASVRPYDGWTDLVISPDEDLQVVDGMITGWHEPASSHLMMLEAIAGRELLQASYEAALTQGFRWHEFGDTHLILP
jgi:S-adenosylmethionine:tRNA ribosyltransferase-isomerase